MTYRNKTEYYGNRFEVYALNVFNRIESWGNLRKRKYVVNMLS